MHTVEKIAIALLGAALLIAIPLVSLGTRERLDDGARSVDELVDQLLGALERNDPAALRRLRVSEREYQQVILPGSVGPGEPLRRWPDDAVGYFWGELDAKSKYSEESMLQLFGGHKYRRTDLQWDKGIQRYATYTAYKQLRLDLEEAGGSTPARLETGSVAEVHGRFKFVSFRRD